MKLELTASIAESAAKFVELGQMRGDSAVLDYSRASLALVEDMATEAAEWSASLSIGQRDTLVRQMGSYLLEVARREFGGDYLWHEVQDQPVLVVGEPAYHLAMMTWNKVRSRLGGDPADNLLFFYEGFADRIHTAAPGTRALYV